jgi:hypothetical protein
MARFTSYSVLTAPGRMLESGMQTVTVTEIIVFLLSMGVILYLWML